MRCELLAWGDGTIRLSFWDSLHGSVRDFILGEDGRAYIEIEQSDGTEIREPVDLIAELRKMATQK